MCIVKSPILRTISLLFVQYARGRDKYHECGFSYKTKRNTSVAVIACDLDAHVKAGSEGSNFDQDRQLIMF
ncbi:hypothetical protein F5Y18DRAFT_405682 [Xylariaceae sp. FL1019]|nr:hypothetical protein F5Y18DRAFT_405682 [Xylariaceae sp. FL1019]